MERSFSQKKLYEQRLRRSTKGSQNANYLIDPSRLREPQPGCTIERFGISAGQYVTCNTSVALGIKDVAVHLKRTRFVISGKRFPKKRIF